MGNIHVKLFQFLTSSSVGDVVKRKFMDDRQRPITIAHLELWRAKNSITNSIIKYLAIFEHNINIILSICSG